MHRRRSLSILTVVAVVAVGSLLSAIPAAAKAVTGKIDSISPTGLAQGTAYDPDRRTSSIRVQFYIDCAPTSPTSPCFAGETLTSAGSTHVFVFQIPSRWADQQQHRLYARGIDITKPSSESRTLSPSSGMVFRMSSPITGGSLDGVDADPASTPGAGIVKGRVTDPDGPVLVKILVDCEDPAAPGCVVAETTNVPATGEFQATLPSRYADGAPHAVRAYALDNPGHSPNVLLPGKAYYRWHPDARVLGGVPLRTNLRYFGFAGVADWPNTGPRNMREVMYSSNLIVMQEGGGGTGTSDLPAKLELARSMGQNVLLDVTWQFFTRDGNNWVRRGNWSSQWNWFADQIAPWADTIVAFSVMDEPYHTSPDRLREDILGELEDSALAIKQRFPESAVTTVFAWTTLLESMTTGPVLQVPANFDWLGFDCYGSFDACGDERGTRSITEYAVHLKSKFHPGQKLVLVPQSGATSNWSETVAVELADRYYGLAYDTTSPVRSDIVAITPFLWETRDLEQHWTGARDLPASRARYLKLGTDLLPAGNQAPVGDLNGLAGTILRGWALDPDTPGVSSLVEIAIDGIAHPALAGARRLDVNRGMEVGGLHGIEFEIPCEFQDDRFHVVDLYGIDTSTALLGARIDTLQIRLPWPDLPGQACP